MSKKLPEKNYLKGYLKGTHIRILKLVSKCWHFCDNQVCAVTQFWHSCSCSSPRVVRNPQEVSRNGSSSLQLLAALPCPAPAPPAAPARSHRCCSGGNTALRPMVGDADSPQLPNRWAGFTKMESGRVLCGFKMVVESLCAQGYEKSHGTGVWYQTPLHICRTETIIT